ncbi:Mov34/MPN/PAD-1 family protein [Aurantiacibacter zhengii]|uniref:Mov34/MPN/PAD-1 family protein n=1 Tax=Aurantiacibacter zhengii TaxID=2307003 RepID=UPI0026ACD7F7|nr:Mov34/MPN/PAD-1 family protein [Aurantiacibacter zhengii]
MPFWTYILHCNAGRFYTGHTDDLDKRIWQHENGVAAGFTRNFLPVKLVWSQEFTTREEAKAAEKQIKGWSRKKKLALIRGDWDAVTRYAKSESSPSTGSGQSVWVEGEVIDLLRGEAARAYPAECCGILLGRDEHITAAVPARNVHPAPQTHFEIDPQALIDAHRTARQGGPQVVGYYHSHPEGPPRPSATDRAQAAHDGMVWAIICADAIGWWHDTPDGFAALPYRAIPA